MAERDLDVVVFGATGVTGRRVAAYLAERAPETGASWAAAARNPDKLAQALDAEGVSAPETIVADLDDPGSLAAMAARARVVLNLVGPYTIYGRPVVEACVANGAHYADLTGEMPFVREILLDYDRRAAEAGVKLVQVCGFESLPPDMAIALAAAAARERWDEDLAAVDLELNVRPPRGTRPTDLISGGTFQSFAEAAGAEDASPVTDPAALITDPATADEVRRRSPIALMPRRGRNGAVIAPMQPAAFINPAVIHRSAAIDAESAGRPPAPFRYREGVALGGGAASLPLRYVAAGAIGGMQAVLGAGTRAGPSARRRMAGALRRILPSSGFGPSPDRLEGWRWRMSIDARTAGAHEASVAVDADGHPGYLATARMLGEAGLLLAEDGATPDRAGHLTPATALGTASADRFERARLRFSVAG